MSEATAHLASPVDPYLGALAKVAAMLEWPLPRERDEAVCAEAARVVDRLLAPFTRSCGAVDVAIGDRLDLLSKGDRVLRLGYSGIGDHARERLGSLRALRGRWRGSRGNCATGHSSASPCRVAR